MSPCRRRDYQRGSALLIVFVMAAAIAILLYIEIPITAFEARRNREQDLINRGEEYAHAVKLFVRKLGTYPPTLDALSDTNRIRFLRHRFVDPFTGKDDWRLLHAGPGGLLLDSRVSPLPTNNDGQSGSGAFPGMSPGGVSAASGIAALSNGVSETAGSATEQLTLPPLSSRRPATAAGDPENNLNSSVIAYANPDPTVSLLPSTPSETANFAAAQIASVQVAAASTGSSGASATTATQPEGPAQGAVTPGSSALGVKAQLAGLTGPLMAGGIAGVASNADAHAIKSINQQRNYSLWEFYYNPLQDPLRMGFWVPPAASPNAAPPASSLAQPPNH